MIYRYLNIVIRIIVLMVMTISLQMCKSRDVLKDEFINPPGQYKPMPFWHINGELTTEGIREQMIDAKELAGFSGVTVLPLSARSESRPGTSPDFLSDEFFNRYFDILQTARELDMQVILYDDIDFPSGMAGGNFGIILGRKPKPCVMHFSKPGLSCWLMVI